jgi:hypothetical protein
MISNWSTRWSQFQAIIRPDKFHCDPIFYEFAIHDKLSLNPKLSSILKINWFAKVVLPNVFILSKDEANLVFKDISSSL